MNPPFDRKLLLKDDNKQKRDVYCSSRGVAWMLHCQLELAIFNRKMG